MAFAAKKRVKNNIDINDQLFADEIWRSDCNGDEMTEILSGTFDIENRNYELVDHVSKGIGLTGVLFFSSKLFPENSLVIKADEDLKPEEMKFCSLFFKSMEINTPEVYIPDEEEVEIIDRTLDSYISWRTPVDSLYSVTEIKDYYDENIKGNYIFIQNKIDDAKNLADIQNIKLHNVFNIKANQIDIGKMIFSDAITGNEDRFLNFDEIYDKKNKDIYHTKLCKNTDKGLNLGNIMVNKDNRFVFIDNDIPEAEENSKVIDNCFKTLLTNKGIINLIERFEVTPTKDIISGITNGIIKAYNDSKNILSDMKNEYPVIVEKLNNRLKLLDMQKAIVALSN